MSTAQANPPVTTVAAPADVEPGERMYDPSVFFYKVRNDRSLEDGPLSAVLARVPNWGVYDPVLAHYLAFLLSLECDELTTPVFAVTERLRWTPIAEYAEYDGLGALCLFVDGTAIIGFRSLEPFDRVLKDLRRMRQSADARVPARVAVAERQRLALKKDPHAQLPKLPRPEDEPLFDMGDEKVGVLSAATNRYLGCALEVRSFVEDNVGAPVPILDAIRLLMTSRASGAYADTDVPVAPAPSFDGLSQYHVARPRIIVTGVGTGGAVAQLCALDMASLYGRDMVCCYTFGQSKLANYKFAKLYTRMGGKTFRVVNRFDPVVKLPSKLIGFCHPDNTRVRYAYPPSLARAGYMEGMAKPSKKAMLSLLKQRGANVFRGDAEELKAHATYVGIQLAMRLTAQEPFPFVVYRMVDKEPPQPRDARAARAPPRAEVDLHQAEAIVPWDLVLRDLAPGQRTGMKRRLQVYSGSKQSPWSTYASPADEYEVPQHSGPVYATAYDTVDAPAPQYHFDQPQQKTQEPHVRFVPAEQGIGGQ